MTTFSKAAKGWRAQVAVSGVRESKTFSTKTEATSWAAKRETEIRADAGAGIERGRTLDDAFRGYEKEVCAHKKAKGTEVIRMAAIGRMALAGVAPQGMKLTDITPAVLGTWRNERRKKVKRSFVNRDLTCYRTFLPCCEGMEIRASGHRVPLRDRNRHACQPDYI